MSDRSDPWSRVHYRRLIAWPERIAREAPLLGGLLEAAPEASLLDLGCGTGEHVAWAVARGARAVGVDRSEAQIGQARQHGGRFVVADVQDLDLPDEPFGVAICLGNTLPHLLEDEEVDRFLTACARHLLPGGRLLVQLLNYERILRQGLRALPVNVRPEDDGTETVFLRLMKREGDRILFFPTTLSLDATAEEPVSLRSTRRVPLRPWTRADLGPRMEAAGFAVSWLGSMTSEPFDADTSTDLVALGMRS